ncbi:MAG: hypothetical protein HY619_01615 [Thaumarchaeota archaeon]|nr:hypothetical protein [Nitrososphaerota archaeon]
MTYEMLKTRKYWFSEADLITPIDWDYVDSLPQKVKLSLELYMEGRVSIGKAAEVASLPFREFDQYRAKARIPLRGPHDK